MKNANKSMIISVVSVFLIVGNTNISALAGDDWNERVNYWKWVNVNEVEMWPNRPEVPIYNFYKISDNSICRNISGDFENIARGLEFEKNENLTIKFFSCDPKRSDVGVLCIDTGQDGGFETCGIVGKKSVEALAARVQKSFEVKPRPKN